MEVEIGNGDFSVSVFHPDCDLLGPFFFKKNVVPAALQLICFYLFVFFNIYL